MPRFRPRLRSNGDSDWEERALCQQHLELPWISDHQPRADLVKRMYGVCAGCPVIQKCAAEASHQLSNRGVIGGYYAGVWIPWPSYNQSQEGRRLRLYARRVLQRRAMITVTVYSKSDCNGCYATKQWLERKGIPFTEIDVEANDEVALQLINEGLTSLPVVRTSDGRVWTGFRVDELKGLAAANGL